MTLDLDGSIQPREEAGIGPEMAAIASSLNVYEKSPSTIDRGRGISYLSETVPQMIGVDGLKLARTAPTWRSNRAFRKKEHKNVRKEGLTNPSHRAIKPREQETAPWMI